MTQTRSHSSLASGSRNWRLRGSSAPSSSRQELRKHHNFSAIFSEQRVVYTQGSKGRSPIDAFVEFVKATRPDWFPIPADFIPSPDTSAEVSLELSQKTAAMNETFAPRGFVPVVHVDPVFARYFERAVITLNPTSVAIGGLVPLLLHQTID